MTKFLPLLILSAWALAACHERKAEPAPNYDAVRANAQKADSGLSQ